MTMPRIYNRPQTSTLDQEHQPVAVLDRPPAPKPKAQPATTPPVAVTAPEEVRAILDRRAKESSLLLNAAEQVLLAIVQGQNPTAEERSLLVSLGFVGEKLKAETVRMTRVLNWQARAGTAEGRDQARQARQAAEAELATRGPQIEAEQARLQAELATLQATAEQTAAVCEKQAESLKSLRNRDLLPEQIRAELDDLTRTHRDQYAVKIRALRSEIERTAILAAMVPTDRACVEFAEMNRLPCHSLRKTGHDSAVGQVDPAGWRQYLAQRQADDIERQAELDQLEVEAAPLIERRETLLSFYVR
jgi:hypothetical protein